MTTTVATSVRALSDEERALVIQVATAGPTVLLDGGMSAKEAREFLERHEVRAELERINLEFQQQDVLNALTKFVTRRAIAKMAPDAVSLLRKSLAGPEYEHYTTVNAEGQRVEYVRLDVMGRPVIRSTEPTAGQFRAAQDILDRIGLAGEVKSERTASVNLNVLFNRAGVNEVELEMDPALSREQQTLSRERMRNVIDALRERLPEIKSSAPAKGFNKAVVEEPSDKPQNSPRATSVRKVKVKRPA